MADVTEVVIPGAAGAIGAFKPCSSAIAKALTACNPTQMRQTEPPIEILLNGGTEDISPKELNEFLSDRNSGGSLIPNADYVYGEINFPKEYREEVIKLSSDTLRSPKFDPRWVHRIKGSIR